MIESFVEVVKEMRTFATKKTIEKTLQQTVKIEETVNSAHNDIGAVKAGVVTIKTDIAHMKENMAKFEVIESNISAIKRTICSISSKLDQHAEMFEELIEQGNADAKKREESKKRKQTEVSHEPAKQQ